MTEPGLAVVQGATVLDRLAAIPLGESGTVECLVVSPRPGEHRLVPEIRVIPGLHILKSALAEGARGLSTGKP